MLEVVTIIQYMGKIPAVDVRLLNSKKPAKNVPGMEVACNQEVTCLKHAMDLPVRLEKVGRGKQKKVLECRFLGCEVIMVWGLIRIALFSGSFLVGLTFWGPGRASPKQTVQPAQIEQPQSHRDIETIHSRRSHMVFLCVSVPLWLP